MLKKLIFLLGNDFIKIIIITAFVSIFTVLIDTFFLVLILGYLGESFGYETNISEKLTGFLGSNLIANELFILSIFGLRSFGAMMTGFWNAKSYTFTVGNARLQSLNFLLRSDYSNFIKQDIASTTQAFTTLPLQLGSLIRGAIDLISGTFLLLSLVVILVADFGSSMIFGLSALGLITVPFIMYMKKKLLIAGSNAMLNENRFISLVNFTLSSFRFIRSARIEDEVDLSVNTSITGWQSNTKKSLFIASTPKVFIESLFIFAIIVIGLSETGVSFITSHLPVLLIVFVRAIPALSSISGSLQNLQFHWEPSLRFIELQYQWASGRRNQSSKLIKFDGMEIVKPIVTSDPSLNFGNLQFNSGDKKVIHGPSGSGKSILLDCLSGFREIEEGSYKSKGSNHVLAKSMISWKNLVYCAQDEKLFEGTVSDNIFFATSSGALNPNKKTIDEILGVFSSNLDELYKQPIIQNTRLFSGGQKQLLILCRAIAQKPKLLFLDELTASLDISLEAKVMNIISKNHQDLTILMISHRTNPLLKDFDAIQIQDLIK